jgi:hypothetical protein
MTDEMDGVEVTGQERPLYYLVVCPDTGEPIVEICQTLEDLAGRLIDFEDIDAHVMPFCGRRLYVSEGDMKYLLDEGHAEPIPLFTVPKPGENAKWNSIVRFGTDAISSMLALGTPADVVEEESVEEPLEEEEEEEED